MHFELVLLKELPRLENNSKYSPHQKVKKRKKEAWIKLEAKIGL